MKSTDQEIRSMLCSFVNAAGSGPGVTWLNSSPGVYDCRLTEPGAKLIAAIPQGLPGATQAQWVTAPTNTETPSRAVIQFLSPAGAAGNYGGTLQILWKKPV